MLVSMEVFEAGTFVRSLGAISHRMDAVGQSLEIEALNRGDVPRSNVDRTKTPVTVIVFGVSEKWMKCLVRAITDVVLPHGKTAQM